MWDERVKTNDCCKVEFMRAINKIWAENNKDNWMIAYDKCFRLCTAEEFKFGYDYVVNKLESEALKMSKQDFLVLAKRIHGVLAYMNRYDIPLRDLPTIQQVAEQLAENCLK